MTDSGFLGVETCERVPVVERKTEDKTETLDDATLISRALAKDAAAFEVLVSRYERPLEGILASYSRDRHQLRDWVQDAVLRAYQNLHRYRDEHRFSTWFFRIGVNLAISTKRRARNEQRFMDSARAGADAELAQESPLEGLLAVEDASSLKSAMLTLPARYQKILKMRYAEDQSCTAIAEALGTTANTVSIILFRAKQRLRAVLEQGSDRAGEGDPPEPLGGSE